MTKGEKVIQSITGNAKVDSFFKKKPAAPVPAPAPKKALAEEHPTRQSPRIKHNSDTKTEPKPDEPIDLTSRKSPRVKRNAPDGPLDVEPIDKKVR